MTQLCGSRVRVWIMSWFSPSPSIYISFDWNNYISRRGVPGRVRVRDSKEWKHRKKFKKRWFFKTGCNDRLCLRKPTQIWYINISYFAEFNADNLSKIVETFGEKDGLISALRKLRFSLIILISFRDESCYYYYFLDFSFHISCIEYSREIFQLAIRIYFMSKWNEDRKFFLWEFIIALSFLTFFQMSYFRS
jgi:hypothetical protein